MHYNQSEVAMKIFLWEKPSYKTRKKPIENSNNNTNLTPKNYVLQTLSSYRLKYIAPINLRNIYYCY